jgi:hypothetical protein
VNHKRRKNKTKVRCGICTPHRNGNHGGSLRRIEVAARADEKLQRQEAFREA